MVLHSIQLSVARVDEQPTPDDIQVSLIKMHPAQNIELAIALVFVTTGIVADSKATDDGIQGKAVPPVPKFQGTFDKGHAHQSIANRIESWTNADKQNVWELSGLHEGDIMVDVDEDGTKNGLINVAFRWPAGVVPYYIKEEDFDDEDIETIQGAMAEYHNSTCIRFRPYRKTDRDYITIEGKMSGCWSLVGRHDRGQVVNLQNPGCVKHGVIVHELMHALGFYHQQSAADRDEWVTINWQNVKPGKEHNFNRYDNRTVTDYGIGYDYTSVMHYSSYAFSRNGEPTITPKKEKVKLGQRKGLSGKDVLKLQEMYKKECSERDDVDLSGDVSIDWILDSSYNRN